MRPNNKEIQQRKNCELYTYVLEMLEREIPEEIVECLISDDFFVDCVEELGNTLHSLDNETFDKLVNNKNTTKSQDLKQWWNMYQEAEKLHKSLASDMPYK